MNDRKAGIVIGYVNIFLLVFIGFMYVPLLLHYLGQSEYGLYQLIGSLIAYFSVMDFGLTGAVVRFYARFRALGDKKAMENLLAGALRMYGAVTILVLGVGCLCYAGMDHIFSATMTERELAEAHSLFLLLLFNVGITLFSMVFRAIINAHEKFLFLKGTETVQFLLQPLLVVLILQEYPSAFSVALAQTVLNVVLSLWRMYYCFAHLHVTIHFYKWNKELLREFRRLALSVFAVGLIDQVFFKANQVILGIMSGTDAVAVYAVAALIYMNYTALSSSISGVYLPHVTGMIARREPMDVVSALFIRIGRCQYVILALPATGFIIFGVEFIDLWAGPAFADAYGMTLLIIIPFTIDLIQNIGLSIMQAQNRYDFRAKVYLAMGIFNLCLAIPLGKLYGGIGCAFATGLSMFIGNGLIMNWYYARVTGLAIQRFWREIGHISIAVILSMAIGFGLNMAAGDHGVLFFAGKVLAYALLYSAILWKLAMNEEEKGLVRRCVARIRGGRE